jgi:hypothetical protein
MSQISILIDECIKLGIAGLLKSHGFKKSGRSWHKKIDENWQIVNVQASSGNLGSEGKFAINIGVFQSEIEAFCGKSLTRKPKEYDSTIRRRLGVTETKSDHWWSIDSNTDSQNIADDVVLKLENQGFSWLDNHLAVKIVSASLAQQPSIQSFSAALLSGDKGEAIRRVKAAIEDRPRAKASFTKWVIQAGLEI